MPRTRPETAHLIDRATRRITARHEIEASAEAIFDRIADAASWVRWFPGMRSCGWLTGPPYGVGSRRRVRVGPLEVDERFIVWERPHRWGFTFLRTNVPLARAGVELVELRPTDRGATAVTYTMALDLPRGLTAPSRLVTLPVATTLQRGLAGLAGDLRDHPA
jgi:hypothetical protein